MWQRCCMACRSACFFRASAAVAISPFSDELYRKKAPDAAIRIAALSGLPLKIAAKIDNADKQYYEDRIAPLLGASHVEFVGEIGECDKAEFLGNAAALLFPIVWPEPFGLVMIEAMACGTPVIAYPNGSVPEIIEDGVTGFIVDGEQAAAKAVSMLRRLNRLQIRQTFERRFTARRMAEEYVKVYQRVVSLRLSASTGCLRVSVGILQWFGPAL